MPIEVRELQIKVTVTGDGGTAPLVNGGDEMYRTQYGNNNAYVLDPARAEDLLVAETDSDAVAFSTGWGSSVYQYADVF